MTDHQAAASPTGAHESGTDAASPHRIDVHHHLIPAPMRAQFTAMGTTEVAGRELPEWSPDLSLGVMDRHGIEFALLSVSAPGMHFGDDDKARVLARACNDASAGIVAESPHRFGFFASLPLPDLDGALDEAARALDELGADGIVLLSSHSDGSYLGDPRFDPLMAELDRRGATVFIHPAIPTAADHIDVSIPLFAMEFTFDTTRAAFNLAYQGTLERYPNIRFILSHAGGTVPYLAARFDLLWFQEPELVERAPKGGTAYLRTMYYDTALSANPHALRSLQELVGIDRILFGSDYPFAPELATLLQVEGLAAYDGFTPEEQASVARNSALTLFPTIAPRLRS